MKINKERDDLKTRRKVIDGISDKIKNSANNIQNVKTPYWLCEEILGKLNEHCDMKDKTFLVFNLEFYEILYYKYKVPVDNITFVTDSEAKKRIVEKIYHGKFILTDFNTFLNNKNGDMNMKFDCVVMNPPYQAPQKFSKKKGGGTTLWDKFINIGINSWLNQDGFLCSVNPIGWRSPKGSYKEIQKLILSLNLIYLESHDAGDGLKTFGAGTAYDWFVMSKNKEYKGTKIKNGLTYDFSDFEFIPSDKIEEIEKIIAKDGEEKVEVIYSRSNYGSDKKWVAHKQDDDFKYPVAHNINVKGEPKIIWAKEDRGHFGIPKVIFGRRQCGLYLDINGEFGVSQDCRAITDKPENLEKIKEAMENPIFIELMSYCNTLSTAADKYDKNILACFRKDFWKEFI